MTTAVGLSAQGKVEQPARYEREKKFNDPDYNILSVEQDGLVLFRDNHKFGKIGQKLWEIVVLDTSLQEKFVMDLEMDSDRELLGYEYGPGKFYMLFREGQWSKSDWELVELGLVDSAVSRYLIKNELEIELSHFIISSSTMVLGGSIQSKPTVLAYSLQTKKTEVLPGFYRKETRLVNLNRNVNGTFNVLLLEKGKVNESDILRLNVFSDNGDLLLQSAAVFDRETPVISGVVSELKNDDLVILGSYGKRGTKTSRGLYFIKVKPGENNDIKFTALSELSNFFRYMGPKREARVLQKIKKAHPSQPWEYRGHLAIWDIHEKDNKYWLTGEVIDPQYSSSRNRLYSPYDYTNYGYGFYGTRYYRSFNSLYNSTELISVKYRQGFYVGFDTNGKALWDASLPVDEIETSDIEQVSAFGSKGDKYQIIYRHEEDGLYYTSGSTDNISRADSLITIRLKDPSDELKTETQKSGKVEWWFDNVFFAWGFQRIHNKINDQRRHVFYINKICIE